jgi:bacterioferritin-associated ferredoxin
MRGALAYQTPSCRGLHSIAMIVCSCNVLSDAQVRSAVTDAAPRSAGRVYGCLGCSPQCGRCLATIRRIMNDALDTDPQTRGCCGTGEAAERGSFP